MDNSIKLRLKAILSNHEGKDNAIKRRELRQILNYKDDRQMRIMIRELISEGLPVISTTSGYYIPLNQQEAIDGIAFLRSYLIEDAKRIRDLKRACSLWLTPGIQRRMI